MTAPSDPQLISRSVSADSPIAPTADSGVIVSERDRLGIATVLARKGQHVVLAQRLRECLGIDLPQGPRRTAAGELALAGIGLGTWLATIEGRSNAFAATLEQAIGDLASVSDQSDGYVILRLSGIRVRDVLCRLVPIDIHPRAFKVGDVTVTVASHIGATLWRLEDQVDGGPVFEVAVNRSLAKSFWHTLCASASEFGLELRSGPAVS